ncbi:MAG: DUF5119 domain-containing protein [Prevotellaceae bacterium]|nr:DUF5119 domain-containing protein [Prevotellaceae bacterium]
MTQKKNIYRALLPAVLLLGMLAVSCTNKDLWWGGANAGVDRQKTAVVFEWTDAPAGYTPRGTMRTNLFSRTPEFASYGVSDLSAVNGGTMYLPVGASYNSVAYSYNADAKVYFRNENDSANIEAYTSTMSRTTYTRAFPEERTVASIADNVQFYVGWLSRFDVVKSEVPDTMVFVPHNVLHTCFFEVRGITGAENITDSRGALSGMSPSYFLMRRELSSTPVTLFFASSVEVQTGSIHGSFSTFGRLDTENNFTIEILYPSATDGILQFTWDVTGQMIETDENGDYHILIDGSDIVVPNEGTGESGGGFDADVNDWKEETITF